MWYSTVTVLLGLILGISQAQVVENIRLSSGYNMPRVGFGTSNNVKMLRKFFEQIRRHIFKFNETFLYLLVVWSKTQFCSHRSSE